MAKLCCWNKWQSPSAPQGAYEVSLVTSAIPEWRLSSSLPTPPGEQTCSAWLHNCTYEEEDKDISGSLTPVLRLLIENLALVWVCGWQSKE